MKGKIAFVLGAAIGYVLGTRAGRERYEQIKRGAQRVWQTEPVQRGVAVVKEAADDRVDDLKTFVIRIGGNVFDRLSKNQQAKTKSSSSSAKAAAGSTKQSPKTGSGTQSRASASPKKDEKDGS